MTTGQENYVALKKKGGKILNFFCPTNFLYMGIHGCWQCLFFKEEKNAKYVKDIHSNIWDLGVREDLEFVKF